MDAWIEEEIAQELEKMGIEDIETTEEDEYSETTPFNLIDIEPSTSFDFQKYQTLQLSYWKNIEDGIDESKAILIDTHNNNGLNENTTPVQCLSSSQGDSVQPHPLNESLSSSQYQDEDGHSSLKVLCQLREQEQIERDSIQREIEQKKAEIETFALERRTFLAKIEDERCKQERDRFRRMQSSCIVVQSYWRGYRSRRQTKIILNIKKEMMNKKKESATIVIQRNWRKYYKMLNIYTTKIQKYWRNYRHRKMIDTVLAAVRQNVKENEIVSTITDNSLMEDSTIKGNEISHLAEEDAKVKKEDVHVHVPVHVSVVSVDDKCALKKKEVSGLMETDYLSLPLRMDEHKSMVVTGIFSDDSILSQDTNNGIVINPLKTEVVIATNTRDGSGGKLTAEHCIDNVHHYSSSIAHECPNDSVLSMDLINDTSLSLAEDDLRAGQVSNKFEESSKSVHPKTVSLPLDSKTGNDLYKASPNRIDYTKLPEGKNELGDFPGLHSLNEHTKLSSIARLQDASLSDDDCCIECKDDKFNGQKEEDSHRYSPLAPSEPVVLSCSESESSNEYNKGIIKSSSSVWGNTNVSNRHVLQKALSEFTTKSVSKADPPPSNAPLTKTVTSNFNSVILQNEQNATDGNTNSTLLPLKSSQSVSDIKRTRNTLDKTSQSINKSLMNTDPSDPKADNSETDSRHELSVSSPCLVPNPTNMVPFGITESTPSQGIPYTDELQDMIALKESRSREEFTAQSSRVRMSQLFSAEQISDMADAVRKTESYASRIEYAANPLSPNAWVGLIEERLRSWQEKRIYSNNNKLSSSSSHQYTNRSVKALSTSSRLVPLSKIQILSASPEGTTIDEVTLVHIYCSRSQVDLTSLSQCSTLCSLFLAKCQLTSFYNIGQTKTTLKEIVLSSNMIDSMDFSQTPSLTFLDLSENRLASIHGLETCRELLELNLNENRIARIGGLKRCSKLQKLFIEGNLIIDSSGISCLPDLQYLSFGENHLPSLVGIEECPVLQCVNLQQNNLQMCPPFTNHCLLRELILSENCLSDITLLERSWLPLLQTLDIANNCISSIDSLAGCIMLNSLHIQHNNIYDLASFLHSIHGCYELCELYTTGNPFEEEPKYKKILLKAVHRLRKLNGKEIGTLKKKPPSHPKLIADNPVYKLCLRQIQEQDNMRNRHQHAVRELDTCNTEINSPKMFSSLLDRKMNNCKEYSDLLRCHLKEQATFNGSCHMPPLYERLKMKQNHSAIIIQTRWRSYKARRTYTCIRLSAILIQSWWRGLKETKQFKSNKSTSIENRAATCIQAHVKGYVLRKKLRRILSQMKDDNEIEEEEEIEISFDESLVSDESMRPLTPNDAILDRYMSIYGSNNNNPDTSTSVIDPNGTTSTNDHLMTVPKFTLPGAIDEEEVLTHDNVGKAEVSGFYPTYKKERNFTGSKERVSSAVSNNNKQEKQDTTMDDTWGFVSTVTADLMKKRTNRHRKLHRAATDRSRLQDPIERLTLFKRTSSDKQINVPNTCSHKRHQEPMKFQWAHERKVVHSEALPYPKRMSNIRHHSLSPSSGQTTFLPELEPHVLAGHAPRLVTSGIQNERVKKRNLDQISGSPTKPNPNYNVKTTPLSSSVYNAWN